VSHPSEPYLSLVVATRNDDHGGNLMGRTQIFLDGWLTHARRYNIPSELVFVEWNPPVDRPPLAEALQWPADLGPCTVRFIEVPTEVHQRYQHAAGLPLYQMIGKNVGIRRARGRFILATNIDILFSNELAAFLGERRLDANRMYRVDRYDAMSDVPPSAPLDEQLDYCRTHLIRVNRREGTFEVTPDGGPALSSVDIASPESGILPGRGWFTPERLGPGEAFRWAQENAEVLLPASGEPGAALVVDLEPGPASLGKPVKLEVATDAGHVLVRITLDDRSRLRLQLPSPRPNSLWFRATGEFYPVNFNTRALVFRAFRFSWERGEPSAPSALDQGPRTNRILALWHSLQYVIGKLADGGPLVPLTVPVSPRLRRILRFYIDRGGLTGMLLHPWRSPTKAPTEVPDSGPASPEPPSIIPPLSADCLHTNASGDFQLAAREHWFDLRGYPEFDMYSMNIDSAFCFAAQYGGALEEFLPDPMRIYHIEHGSGSGWTPEGQQSLYARLAAKGIPVLDNEDVLRWGAQMRRLNSPMIFNHEDWGLGELDLPETEPSPGQVSRIALDAAVIPSLRDLVPELRAYTGVRQSGPEIEAGLLAAARTLAYTRPLTPYPGWIFGSDWDKPDMECRMRRFIWTYFHNLGSDAPFQMNWHKGLAVQIYLGNDSSLPLFIGGCVDPNEFAFLDSALEEGMVFVDGGANEGLYSLFASRCVGPSGSVFSFEPSQREFDRLSCNIRLNGLDNVRAVQAALSDAPGETELNIACSAHSGHNTLGKFAHEVPLLRTERVSTQTLDAFATEAGLTRLDFLKLDVEGAERRVLEGARDVLRRMRPMILFEASDDALKGQGSSLSDLLEFFRSQNYRIYAFNDRTGSPIPADGETRSDNMVAVPIERPEIQLERAKPQHHKIFDALSVYTGKAEPGFDIDFLGIRTRCEFSAGGIITAMPVHTLEPHEDYFEWIDLLESIMAAKDRYTMMELGAGYGRWSVRAAAALRQLRGLPFHLVAVEGEPRHYRWLEQHMSDNCIPSDARTLIRGVVSDHRDDLLFYVGTASASDEPASWYGQAIIQGYEAVDGAPSGQYEGQDVFQLKSGWKAVKTHSYLLTDILPETDRIDLIDLDVQGEELKVISSAIDTLDRKVARLHIGTHSHEIEAGLRELLSRHGWECKTDYPCAQTNQTPWGPVQFVDGVQSWVNTAGFPSA